MSAVDPQKPRPICDGCFDLARRRADEAYPPLVDPGEYARQVCVILANRDGHLVDCAYSRRPTPTESASRSYYKTGGVSAIEVIEAWGLGFSTGNCIKYVARAGNKPGASRVDDLTKALWYLQRELDTAKREGGGK